MWKGSPNVRQSSDQIESEGANMPCLLFGTFSLLGTGGISDKPANQSIGLRGAHWHRTFGGESSIDSRCCWKDLIDRTASA